MKHIRELIRFAEGLGLSVQSKQTSGNHFKMTLADGDRVKTVIISNSPSDGRAMMNAKGDIKRFTKGVTQ